MIKRILDYWFPIWCWEYKIHAVDLKKGKFDFSLLEDFATDGMWEPEGGLTYLPATDTETALIVQVVKMRVRSAR